MNKDINKIYILNTCAGECVGFTEDFNEAKNWGKCNKGFYKPVEKILPQIKNHPFDEIRELLVLSLYGEKSPCPPRQKDDPWESWIWKMRFCKNSALDSNDPTHWGAAVSEYSKYCSANDLESWRNDAFNFYKNDIVFRGKVNMLLSRIMDIFKYE
jgi:hypothetical protein